MSKIINYIFLFIVFFSLTTVRSCEKEEEVCYSCEKLSTRGEPTGEGSGFYTNPDSTTSVSFCGTEDEAADKRKTYVSLGYSCTKD
jgi:hypothetical protein